MELVTYSIYAFTSVFTIVNPIGGLITFISLTSGMKSAERTYIAGRSVMIACVLAMVFALSGELILRIFGITVDALRIAGGILIFLVAVDMMHARTSRESVTKEELTDASKKDDISVFPIAMPLLTGPGTITTVIVLIRTGKTLELKIMTLLAILLTFALSYLIFRFADRVKTLLGVVGALVVTRVMGLLLAAIAVNFVSVGIWNIYKSWI